MTLRMSNHSKNVATSTGATLPKAMIVLTVTLLSAGGPADTNAFIINRFPGLAARIHRTGSAASVSHSIGQRPFEGSCPSKKRKSRVALLAGASKSPPPSSSSSQPASPAKGKKKPPPGSKRMSFAGGRVKTPTQQQKQQKAGETRKYEKPGEDEEEEEEDVKKSARWGFKPARSASASEGGTTTPKPGSRNPFRALKASFGALGQGATAAKDALYGAADAAGSLAEMRLKTESGSPKEQGSCRPMWILLIDAVRCVFFSFLLRTLRLYVPFALELRCTGGLRAHTHTYQQQYHLYQPFSLEEGITASPSSVIVSFMISRSQRSFIKENDV